MRATLIIGGIVLVLGSIAGASWYWSSTHAPSTESAEPSDARRPTGRAVPEGQSEYRSSAYHFSLLYQKDLAVHEYGGGAGSHTITFENEAGGFQIFVLPYAASTVSNDRFTADLPSGVIQNQVPVTIGGTQGIHFTSSDPMLGDTTQVWFIHGGFLYEVTSPKQFDTALAALMATWEFIN